MDDPNRAKLRRAMDAPKCAKSSTDKDEPHLVSPMIEKDAPSRAKLRKASEAPRCRKSNTANEDPSRA